MVSILLLLAIGVSVFLATYDFNNLKPQIIDAGKKATGRNIDFSKIDLKLDFKEGAQLRLTDVVVGENPDFGNEDFLTAKVVGFGVSIQDFLFKRQISILGINIVEPKVNIIRLKDGRINASAFVAAGMAQSQEPTKAPSKAVTAGLPPITINYVSLKNGRLKYIDRSFEPNLAAVIDGLEFEADKISLTETFPFSMSARFASDKENIIAKGNAQIDLIRSMGILKNVTARMDLVSISMETLRSYMPQLKDVSLPEIKSGDLAVNIELCEIGAAGLNKLNGQCDLTKGSLKMKELAVPVEPIEAKLTLSESAIALDKATCAIGKGRVELTGKISDYLLTQSYEFTKRVRDFDLGECLDQSAYPVKVKGIVSADFALKGQGFDPATALSNVSGYGTAEVKEAQLIDINVLKMVLDKLSFVPNLAQTLEANLPDRYKEVLRKKDTAISSAKTKLEISNKTIVIQSVNIDTEAFSFQGKGTAGFDQTYALDGSFVIPQDLSGQMVTSVSQMQYLLNDSKQIVFPLKVTGKGGAVSFMPDVKQIGANALKEKAGEELQKVLKNVFEKNKPGQAEPAQAQPAPAQTAPANP